MRPTYSPIRRAFLATLFIAASTLNTFEAHAESPPIKKPKLVLVVVIDGLPQEQVVRYQDQFGQGGFRRFLEQGASYSNAHQAHGVTVTAVGHSAVLTGAYPYQHGVISNDWIDHNTLESVYCVEDARYTYLGEDTKAGSGTAPTNLRVTTVGDELRYATGNQSKVVTVSGKDRGAILLAGKNGTAYMYSTRTGKFITSTFYMSAYPEWHQRFLAAKPQDRFYNKDWQPLLKESAYANDASNAIVAPTADGKGKGLPFSFSSKSGKPDTEYYSKIFTSPFLDELTLDFARAALDGENLGRNAAGVTDILGISLSSHDAVNHAYGPESIMSHDHLQRLDRLLAQFFADVEKRVGLDNTLIVLTADHGFPNVPEFSQANHIDAHRIDAGKLIAETNQFLNKTLGLNNVITKFSFPGVLLDYTQIEQKGLKREDVESAAARFMLKYIGIADVFTRSQLEKGAVPKTRVGLLMQRGWHKQLSADIMLVTQPLWYFGTGNTGTSHGSPYAYDTNVPLLFYGKPWIKSARYANSAEVVDIAPTLSHVLNTRPPTGSEGRVLEELLR